MPTRNQPRVPNIAERRLQPWVRNCLLVLTVAVVAVVSSSTTAEASDTTTRWDRFSESAGCGDPFTRTPVTSRTGWLNDSEAILGPFGTYFGRSITEVRSHLRYWTVPHSGGLRVRVHEEMLPALQDVAAGLAKHAADGRVYEITSAGAFTSRTIAGSYRASRHAMGLAIDLNPARNPYRSDGVLITDMPEWFVQTWRDAGFCWGGDWRGSKDTMHFSWMGPGPSGGELEPDPPDTAKTSFRGPVAQHQTEFGPVMSRYVFAIADANSNGTSDVVGVRAHNDEGSVVDIAISSLGFGYCSIGRWFVPDPSLGDADHLVVADIDGDSGNDLVALYASDGSMSAKTATLRHRYEDVSSTTVGASGDSVAFTGADFDGDHHADLWEATVDGRMRIWKGPDFTQLLDDSVLPHGAPERISAGDRDGGDTPELYLLYPSVTGSHAEVLTHGEKWSIASSFDVDSTDEVTAMGAEDYDGDGRSDAQILTASGDLIAYIGNSTTGVPVERWFRYPDWECRQPVLLDYSGTFMDDDSSIFISAIEAIADTGVTRGCNPPFNDRFCPDDPVTRGQMAAFMKRFLDLPPAGKDQFVDDNGSTFENDINAIAAAGITKGCNPPDNDEFCPDDPVTRGQMAAFIVRALGLEVNDHPGFDDVPRSSTFYNDIAKLASAGITKGCNPPDNTRYCPTRAVTRGQMAAFLDRAGSVIP